VMSPCHWMGLSRDQMIAPSNLFARHETNGFETPQPLLSGGFGVRKPCERLSILSTGPMSYILESKRRMARQKDGTGGGSQRVTQIDPQFRTNRLYTRLTAADQEGHGRGRNQPPAMAFSGKMVCGYPIYSPYRPG
jgi:hypothetical protein